MKRLACGLAVAAVTACGSTSTTVAPPRPTPPPPPDASPAAPPDAAEGYAGLGAGSVDPALVAAHAPPALDAGMAARIQARLDVRGAPAGAITERGDRMFLTWRVTGTSQVWRLDGPGAFPVQLTGGGENTSLAGLTRDGAHLVVSRDVGGAENPGLFWMSADGGALTTIFEAPGVLARVAFLPDDDRAVYYLANDREPASYALYRWDVATGARTAVFTEPGLWSVVDRRPRVTSDGAAPAGATATDILLLSKDLGSQQNEIHQLDLATGVRTPLLGVDQPAGTIESFQALFSATPGELLVRTNARSNVERVYRWRAGTFTALSPELPYDVSAMSIDWPRKRLYVTVNRDGFRQVEAMDPATGKAIALPRHPTLGGSDNITLASLTRDGQTMQLAFDGATTLPTVVAYSWATKRWTTWTRPSAPGVDPTAFAKVELMTYPARDGTPVPMFVRRPASCPAPGSAAAGATPCPMVVQFHGGPEIQALPGFNPIAQLYVDAGFVFVEPNVRGSSGYGKAWLDADNGARRLDVVTDIEDCARHLRTTWAIGGVAPKLGVYGRSYGGYSSMYAMTAFAGAFDVGVAEVGISNLLTFLQNTAPYRQALRISEYGDPARDRDALVALSPITHAAKLAAPMLLLQGVNDPRVPVGEAVQFYDVIKAKGLPGGLILFPDEGHGTSKRSNQVLAIGHTLGFFEQHLR
jgi:prolyl oligopeptidase PreP (S9A serine peptidase family)